MKRKKYEIAAILVCLTLLSIFVFMKQGFHLDEVLSLELSNAEFTPWIVPTQPEGRLARFVHNEIDGENLAETFGNLVEVTWDVLQNRESSKLLTYTAQVYEEPVWISREQFADYIQVDGGDAFHYLSVYFNVWHDNHPPLHFMLLHTVFSILQGKSEAWIGCLVNLAAIAVIMVLLVKLGNMLAEEVGLTEYKRAVGIFCVLLYGLSCGAVASVLLIRMYCLLALWCVAYLYFILYKYIHREFDRRNFQLILVTLLGFWTQYFFLFYCILLAALLAGLLLGQRRVRELFCFIRSMGIAAVVGLMGFPNAISDVLSSGRGLEVIDNLKSGFSGYGDRVLGFLNILGESTLFPLFWVLMLVLAVVALILRKGRKTEDERLIPIRASLGLLLVLPPLGYFLLAAKISPYLVDRYMMPIFPFVILAGTLALFALLGAIKQECRGKRARFLLPVVCGIVLVLHIIELMKYDGSYLYQGYGMQKDIARANADYPCICIYDGVVYYENLPEFTYYKSTLLLTYDQLTCRKETDSIRELDRVVVLIKESPLYVEEQVLEFMQEQYGFVVEKIGWRGLGVYGDQLFFMRKDV